MSENEMKYTQNDIESVNNYMDNFTTYEVIKITPCEIVRQCASCGRIRTFYCKDDEFKFCDKCGKIVVNNSVSKLVSEC